RRPTALRTTTRCETHRTRSITSGSPGSSPDCAACCAMSWAIEERYRQDAAAAKADESLAQGSNAGAMRNPRGRFIEVLETKDYNLCQKCAAFTLRLRAVLSIGEIDGVEARTVLRSGRTGFLR